MKLETIIGSVLSSAVIVAMTGTYLNHSASAAISPEIEIIPMQTLPQTLPTLYDVVGEKDLECLVHNIYFESRGESALGQRAVAWVTLNRMFDEQFPNTICEVVWQNGKFSWTHDGKSDTPQDQAALEQAESMAQEVLENYFDRPDPTEGSLYFHADHVRPAWRRSFNRVVQIDKHIFYNLDRG
jgi:spore germination cell wall hydrolase CwlJ-like protein